MRCRVVPNQSLLAAFAGLFTAVSVAVAVAAETASLPEPLFTRQGSFAIPFEIDRPQSNVAAPVSVQLHYSESGPTGWQLYETVTPDRGSFTFRAPHDGEFWFMVRTEDSSGKLRPEGPPRPELRVIVDTQNPQLVLHAEPTADGKVRAHWKVDEPNLAADGVKIEYQIEGADEAWRPVAVSRTGAADSNSVSWPLPAVNGVVRVRAEAVDRAGNRAQSRVEVTLGSATSEASIASRDTRPVAPETSASRYDSSAQGTSVSGSTDARSPAPPTKSPNTWSASTSPDPVANHSTSPSAQGKAGGRGQAPMPPSNQSPAQTPSQPPAQTPAKPATLPTSIESDRTAFEGSVPARTVSSEISAPVTQRVVRPADVGNASASKLQPSWLPPGVRPRMLNVHDIEFEYFVDEIGPAGVAKVELWITRDGGSNWSLLTVDEDRQSPVRFKIAEEGIYGFSIVVESATGLRGEEPHPGDPPNVWVGIDTTAPTARIVAAEHGLGNRLGELTITWEADDGLLARQPVSLAFGARADGPWWTIASNLENSGKYVWRLDDRAPREVYLRIEVRDEAGNVTLYTTPQPISIHPERPKSYIREVRPFESGPPEARVIQNRYFR